MKAARGMCCPTCGATPSSQRKKIVGVRDISVGDYVSNLNPVDGVECPSCGYCFRVSGLDVDDGGMLESDMEYECAPRFCPRCGLRFERQCCATCARLADMRRGGRYCNAVGRYILSYEIDDYPPCGCAKWMPGEERKEVGDGRADA